MSGFLLDTNCISEVVSVKPDANVLAWMDAADERTLYLSALTLGEIRRGIVTLAEGRRRARLEAWLDIDLRNRFAGRILPVDDAVADRWGLLTGEMKLRGTPLPKVDAIIAATAVYHGLTVASRNVSDFKVRRFRSSTRGSRSHSGSLNADQPALRRGLRRRT